MSEETPTASSDSSLPSGLFPVVSGQPITAAHHNALADKLDGIARNLGLESAGLPRLKDDEDFKGEHFNAIADKLHLFDMLRGPGHLCIKLGESDGQGRYAWREQASLPGGEWADNDDLRSGTIDVWPAVEVNGNSAIKAGTRILASVSIDSATVLFQLEGSPS